MSNYFGALAQLLIGMGGSKKNKVTVDNVSVLPATKPIPKGCKEFVYNSEHGQFKTIALNKKNANRKYEAWYEKQFSKS